MDFDKQEFMNVFGYEPTDEMTEWLNNLLDKEYMRGLSDGEDQASYEYDQGYDDCMKEHGLEESV